MLSSNDRADIQSGPSAQPAASCVVSLQVESSREYLNRFRMPAFFAPEYRQYQIIANRALPEGLAFNTTSLQPALKEFSNGGIEEH